MPSGAAPGPKPEGELAHILYVEDEDINWELTEAALRGDFTMHRAKNAREAFAQLRRHAFDLILMDIQLCGSELDGIDITRALRGQYEGQLPAYAMGARSEASIIFVTAYNARYSRDQLCKAGGDELIVKPVDFTRLSLAISRLLCRAITNPGARP